MKTEQKYKFLHRFLHRVGWYKYPHYFSYYIASNHQKAYEEKDDKQHKISGACLHCGFWKMVDNFEEIPNSLKNIKGAWREHCD